jgi:hypothetical protein
VVNDVDRHLIQSGTEVVSAMADVADIKPASPMAHRDLETKETERETLIMLSIL